MKMASLLMIPLSLFVLASCSKSSRLQNSSVPELVNSKIISDRPQNTENIVSIIKLKSPSLFATAKNTEGKIKIDQGQKEQIIKEQNDLIEELKTISSEIKVIYTYKFTINAIAVVAPVKYSSILDSLGSVSSVQKEQTFYRLETSTGKRVNNFDLTSVDFIGASKVKKEQGLKGQGIKIGIIDTGIDYTHAMFMGPGTEQAYKDVNPDTPSDLFPNQKVVGGYDFAGTHYNSSSSIADQQIPRPDANPLDEGGHGTHVAGSAAGIGDGVNTYDGVAHEADLYALKVFGAKGSTGDSVVMAAMEYAADPNGDLDPSDKLDVVNLSLGGAFGKPYILYDLAVKNLTLGGVFVVASAGNSGHNPYIVGAPSTAKEALSVAASVDGMEQNWKFDTVLIKTQSNELLAEVVEGTITKPVADSRDVKGKLVYIGLASSDLSEEQKRSLKGNIALIDRGGVPFADKIKRALDAGAIGIIMANNAPGVAIAMGGEGNFDIPGIMITQALSDQVKEDMKTESVLVDFGSSFKIEKPELIDTLTEFTSRGPRSLDSLIKPEISAPGFNVISANMGKGNKGTPLNGTSMSAPHMSGVMALVKQKYPKLSVAELKSLVMNTSKLLSDVKGSPYPVAMQGAGRIQTDKVVSADLLVMPAALSLGETDLSKAKVIKRKLTLKNISREEKTFTISTTQSKDFEISHPGPVTLSPNESKEITVRFLLKAGEIKDPIKEFEGRLLFKSAEEMAATVPVLAIAKILSKITAKSLSILAADIDESFGSAVELGLKNEGQNKGPTYLFNSLGVDSRKPDQGRDNFIKSRSCDLQTAGYRIIEKEGLKVFQAAVKLYNPVSRWEGCQVSIQFDLTGDKVAEQELVGIESSNLAGLSNVVNAGHYSVLLDAKKVRDLRQKFELSQAQDSEAKANYVSAITDLRPMQTFNHSTVSIVEIDLSQLKVRDDGQVAIKVGTLGAGGIEADDFLGKDKWIVLSLNPEAQGFMDIPEVVEVLPNQSSLIDLTKGGGSQSLLGLFPKNRSGRLGTRGNDTQAITLEGSLSL